VASRSPTTSPPHPAAHTPADLARLARLIYPKVGSAAAVMNGRQHYRPYICPFDVLLDHVPAGSTVLDIGCGGGLWLRLLEATGRVRAGVGFDASAESIELARRSLPAGPPADLRFEHRRVEQPWPGPPEFAERFDVVSIIDVMHHVPPAAQRGLLTMAAGRVAAGGRLIYKDMAARPWWRGWANRLHDLAMVREWINYVDPAAIEHWASEAGLKLIHRSRHDRLWYGHDLLIFQRPANG
jgi:2-polyprenyl-3-methyl-5-hydroxy-6-metoxy-1,4-benzoquinol methylase